MVKILFVEGNVGSGKTSSLEYLQQRFKRLPLTEQPIFILEPVDHWQNLPTIEGQPVNLLNAFYKDIPKYGFCFQTYAFLSRMKLLLEIVRQAENEGREWIICERSIFTDREIFLEALHENKLIESEERAVYHQLWDFWISILQPHFANIEIHFLYLTCDPGVSLNHIKNRDREEEKCIDLTYLQILNQKHHDIYISDREQLSQLLYTLTGRDSEFKVYTINNDSSKVRLYKQLDQFINQVLMVEKSAFDLLKIWS